MGVLSRIGKTIKPLVNIPRWMGLGGVKRQGVDIADLAKEVFAKEQPKHNETFEEAIKRLNLSEADILIKQAKFLKVARFYLGLAVGLVLYSIYLTFSHIFLAVVMTWSLALVALSFSFKEHFHYFQMKQRKLGCTIKEWARWTFGGRK